MMKVFSWITGFGMLAAIGASLATTPAATEEPRQTSTETAIATFAGGCFWCMEPPYDELDGVISTISGYMGGHEKNPTYKSVSSGRSGHTEVVQIKYDPSKVNYAKLVEVFWVNIDPLAKDRQFCDSGSQYRSAIFFHNEEQEKIARQSLEKLDQEERFKGKIATEISPSSRFYKAERYHQNYYQKNPLRYKYYRHGCGRDKRLKELWGKG